MTDATNKDILDAIDKQSERVDEHFDLINGRLNNHRVEITKLTVEQGKQGTWLKAIRWVGGILAAIGGTVIGAVITWLLRNIAV